jgi:enoyl-CoA hydratase/carnithine racemase
VSDKLLFEIKEGIATITLNHPDKLNAFDDGMLSDWIDALEQCRTSDDVNVIVLTGAGRAFCSGGDVGGFKERSEATPAKIKQRIADRTQRLPKKFAEIDKPIIAAINGAAYGGGLDVAMMCDLRFAAESAKLAETYARMGLVPGAGGAWYLPRLIGAARALEMFWTTEPITAREAERIGLVNRVFPDDKLMEGTYAVARKIADGAPLSNRIIKKVLYQGLTLDLNGALDLVASNMPIVRTSEDHQEAVAAFKEKRKPAFKGR